MIMTGPVVVMMGMARFRLWLFIISPNLTRWAGTLGGRFCFNVSCWLGVLVPLKRWSILSLGLAGTRYRFCNYLAAVSV